MTTKRKKRKLVEDKCSTTAVELLGMWLSEQFNI